VRIAYSLRWALKPAGSVSYSGVNGEGGAFDSPLSGFPLAAVVVVGEAVLDMRLLLG